MWCCFIVEWVMSLKINKKKNEKSKLKMCWICDKILYYMVIGS